jgi:plastocyanin
MRTTKVRRFSFLPKIALALGAVLLVCASANAATIHGATDADVLWVSAPKAAPKPIEGVLTNRNRSFIPPLTVIPVGSTIRFPNEDPFFHSIYSTSPQDPFDIGFYDNGPGKTVPFPNPGIIDVHCHIHASMHATIIVVDGPYAQSSNGAYTLTDVPAGKYLLHAWDLAHGDRTMTVDVPTESADLTLDIRISR